MKTQEELMSLFNPDLKKKLALTNQNEIYKGYRLLSEVKHCGMGGNFWQVTVVGVNKNSTLATFTDGANIQAIEKAKRWVDCFIS